MSSELKAVARKIYTGAIDLSKPEAAVKKALSRLDFPSGRIILIAFGKAAWDMSNAAYAVLKSRITAGAVITKYGYSRGKIGSLEIYEAAHPLPDENGVLATKRALELTKNLTESDTVLCLISGGGSALFELPLIPLEELIKINDSLIKSGADITEINTVRKHLSAVKGGRFAEKCGRANVASLVLSDVIGNSAEVIASGPTVADKTTGEAALGIMEKYKIPIKNEVKAALLTETPKVVKEGEYHICGSLHTLCESAARICGENGFNTKIITESLTCTAKEAAELIAATAIKNRNTDKKLAFIFGGETVVKVEGSGKGGRNQHIALCAAKLLDGYKNILVFSVGSDGTDGPTDAAGGIVSGDTAGKLRKRGTDTDKYIENFDSYNALLAVDSLIFTGATGTNVNDLAVALILPEKE